MTSNLLLKIFCQVHELKEQHFPWYTINLENVLLVEVRPFPKGTVFLGHPAYNVVVNQELLKELAKTGWTKKHNANNWFIYSFQWSIHLD